MNKNTRWAVLYASMAILLCAGAIYSFSVFAKPLSSLRGWSMTEVMLAFTINAAIAPIPTILGGFITDKGKANISIILGGILFAIGFILTGLSTTQTMLYLSYGIVAGLGQGFAYSGCLSNAMRFFPDKRGLAAGLITGAMGGASVITAPIANSIIQKNGVNNAFIYMGIVYLVIIVIASIFIKVAPADYKPEGWEPPINSKQHAVVNKNWKEMLKTVSFYLILAMFGIGAFSGLMIASNAAVISQSMFGLTAAVAATYVSVYALSNCLGRILWGGVSDKLGHEKTLMIIYSVIALSLLALVNIRNTTGLTVGIIGLGLCFGGIMGVFPPLVMKNYGPANQGVNYGIIFVGYSTAAFFAPKVASGMAAKNNGDFSGAFYISIVLVLIGLVLNIIYTIYTKKISEK
ncbi:L-lactate MFS transporter [Gemella cuniculi]|uniref:L-lactate MFS transporter n=1 Tax=Gemella cuniculi TaxID=150240 RepID=UPI00042341A1|nr:OFA family MFS transporter [Gemella cuniculi]